MTPKYILITLLAFILLSCNKTENLTNNEDDPTPEPPAQISALGTWTLHSLANDDKLFEADVISCMKYNKFIVHDDGTANFLYTASDTCYLYKDGSSRLSYGRKGDTSDLVWSQHLNTIRIAMASNPAEEAYGRLEMTGSSKTLTLRDTMPTGLILESIYKQ